MHLIHHCQWHLWRLSEGRTSCGHAEKAATFKCTVQSTFVASRFSEPACDCLESFVSEGRMLHCLRWLSTCGWRVRFARRQHVDFCSREWNIFRWLRPQEKCVQTRDTNSWMGIDDVYTLCNTVSPVFTEYVFLYSSVILFLHETAYVLCGI